MVKIHNIIWKILSAISARSILLDRLYALSDNEAVRLISLKILLLILLIMLAARLFLVFLVFICHI